MGKLKDLDYLTEEAANLFNSPSASRSTGAGMTSPSVNQGIGGQGINSPKAPSPTYASLPFDPNGLGEWQVRLNHPFAMIPATITGGIARFLDQPDSYAGNFHNDDADAYRHAKWSQLLTRFAGPDVAKEFTDA